MLSSFFTALILKSVVMLTKGSIQGQSWLSFVIGEGSQMKQLTGHTDTINIEVDVLFSGDFEFQLAEVLSA